MKTLPLWLALTCSVPAMANQAESCEGTVLSAAQFEFAGTVVPLLKTLRPDGVLCREYVNSTETYQTVDGTQKVQIPKGVLCDNALERRGAPATARSLHWQLQTAWSAVQSGFCNGHDAEEDHELHHSVGFALRPHAATYRLRDDGTGRLLPSDLWAFT
jgi:hypothetical protein